MEPEKIKTKKRNLSFDILRILAMSMIITHHIVINDFGLQTALKTGETIFANQQLFILMVINGLAIIGVNLFFLMSGYFKIKLTMKKLIQLILDVYIVYGVVTAIGILSKNVPLDGGTIRAMIFPFDKYWFLGAYVGLMVLSPFLNRIIEGITKKYRSLIILILLLFSLYAFGHDSGLVINGGYSLIWAVAMYIVGGLISKYDIKNKDGIYVYLASALLLALAAYLIYLFGDPLISWELYKYNNLIVLIESIAIFVWVNSWQLRINNKKIINILGFLAKNTLMVYLLHSTCWLTIFRKIPTEYLINNGHFKLAILLLPIYVLVIYVICASVSVLYNISIRKLIDKVLSRRKPQINA